MEKSRYYNNHQAAVTLMLDDFSLTATTVDGRIQPYNDWGAGLDSNQSLYRYVTSNLLAKYPEIRGSIFYPLQQHGLQNHKAGYQVVTSQECSQFKAFIRRINPHFEFAFHGLTHGRYFNQDNAAIIGNWQHEFSYLTMQEASAIGRIVKEAEQALETKFVGGKYPGYEGGRYGREIVELLDFKWWVSSADMMNRKHPGNKHGYLDSHKAIVDLPTNLSGDCFSRKWEQKGGFIRRLRGKLKEFKIEGYMQFLYEQGLIISIQEHFMGLRTDGKRQRPNIYDDIWSLDKIFGLLRGLDVWHATCTEVARYAESFDNSDLVRQADGTYKLSYAGTWDSMLLSVHAPCRYLKNLTTGEVLQGIYRSGVWVFNQVPAGIYQELVHNGGA